ncbi:nicotinate-nucleotide pyrophosphorylase [carboxylating]-like [Centruroides sculpturatus]|uniref:nicotinate-nucleotide pyrophosphorylase [carboxylating]-like n=1 Tax=Centruroides sculpturatus TaxID=218467 RepID=UPI000C6EF446|nr:nicotinate-nucleotide pyrophosphorylase [carboxylating]-like [Centruroides sculpturatus]
MWEDGLNPTVLRDLAANWLKEDAPNFDYGGFVVGNRPVSAVILAKEDGVLAGIPFAKAILKEADCSVKWKCEEGEDVKAPATVGVVRGRAADLLRAERVMLNCLSRASGVATVTRRMKRRLDETGWKGILAATRKSTPSFRLVEKYSVSVGGGCGHRYDLSSMVMLKDNHVDLVGSVRKAVENAKKFAGFCYKVEVECRSLEEAEEAAAAGCDILMLDNFSPRECGETATKIKELCPRVNIEASGGITEENITDYAHPSVDVISCSRLIQGYKTIDFSMKIDKSSL